MRPELQLQVEARRMPLWPAFAIGGALVLVLFLCDYLTSDHGLIQNSVFWGRDFVNVWTGGHLVREGRYTLLYDLQGYAAYQRSLFGPIGWHNYSYPPVSYPIAALFSLLPYWAALTAWIVSTGALFVAACRRWWPREAGPAWLAVLTPAAILNIWAGHYGFLVGALFLFGWQWLDKHPVRAGVAFGLLLIKPHLALLIPIVLLARREWTALMSGAATVAVLIAGTALCFGWGPWEAFLFRTTGVQAGMIDAGAMFAGLMSPSIASALMQYGAGWTVSLGVQAVAAAGAIAMVAIAAHRRMPTRELAFLVATCTFVALPYAFNYDLTVVCIGAIALMCAPDVRSEHYRLGFYGFVAPQVGMAAAAYSLFLMPVMILGLAIGQYRCWGHRRWNRAPDGMLTELWPEAKPNAA